MPGSALSMLFIIILCVSFVISHFSSNCAVYVEWEPKPILSIFEHEFWQCLAQWASASFGREALGSAIVGKGQVKKHFKGGTPCCTPIFSPPPLKIKNKTPNIFLFFPDNYIPIKKFKLHPKSNA